MSTTALAPPIAVSSRRLSFAWIGTVPFFLFAAAFLIFPSFRLLFGSFYTANQGFTFANIRALGTPEIIGSYLLSLRISVITAVAGALFGALIAYAITWGGLPRGVRNGVLTFSSVAANFGGIPLAFAFITLLGRTGAVPVFINAMTGVNVYDLGFSVYSLSGLSLAYLYFQFPLMVLIMTPAFEGLKREWREAAANLGATPFEFWRYVGLPILMPSLLGSTVLLFGNAFGAYATAFALTGGTYNLITLKIGQQIRGDVLYNPGLSYSMALGMVVVLGIAISFYVWMQRLAARWIR
jgi:putative spermidine/putrescine transport system permease protein